MQNRLEIQQWIPGYQMTRQKEYPALTTVELHLKTERRFLTIFHIQKICIVFLYMYIYIYICIDVTTLSFFLFFLHKPMYMQYKMCQAMLAIAVVHATQVARMYDQHLVFSAHRALLLKHTFSKLSHFQV